MSLEASNFRYSSLYNSRQFEFILEQIEVCCKRMVEKNYPLENDENVLRNVLYKDYLNNNLIREELKLIQFVFTIESPELNNQYHESGRHDIRILNSSEYCYNTELYYIVECKRLESCSSGKGSLNWKYVHEGVKRFVSRSDYPSIYGQSGMLGFLINKLNLNELVYSINEILHEAGVNIPTLQDLTSLNNNTTSNNSYLSIHIDTLKSRLMLYHLLIDFSSVIKKN